ncbi:MAG: HupE/UreJ family protein [Chromatiales bacterium]|nr:HupE/UreJ family protein [Chromatiales bacterium]
MTRSLLATLVLVWAQLSSPARAHQSSSGWLDIRVQGATLDVRLDLTPRDLEFAIGLDADGDGSVTWGELRARQAPIEGFVDDALSLGSQAGPCRSGARRLRVDQRGGDYQAVLTWRARCESEPRRVTVDYRLFAALDAQHRALLRLSSVAGVQSAVLDPSAGMRTFELVEASGVSHAWDYFRHGVQHIGLGTDHLLFVLTLLLPAVFRRYPRPYQPHAHLSGVLADTAVVVTAFTIAHSITLALGLFGWLELSPAFVEPMIAASVIVAALNNVWPVVTRRRWILAFAFGLIHGLGFAGALTELGLPDAARGWALAGFNLGVEAGQLAIVALIAPPLFTLRNSKIYRYVVLRAGSLFIAVIGAFWLTERVAGV